MARGHSHVLGLDIGSSAIKCVELRRTGAGVEVLGRPVVVPTPERSVEGGVIVDTAAVKEAVMEAVARGGFHVKKTILSVGGDSSVVVRITEVPRMSGKELDEAIRWELDRQTPFPIEQTYYDYAPIQHPDADPNAQNMEVLLAVAQEDMINTHVQTVLDAKLVPVSIDVEPLAITRALVESAGGIYADQTVGIVHIGATSSTILIVRKGLLSFVRSVPTAGDALTQAIRQSFMGDEKLSEQVKRAFADLSEDVYDSGGGYPVAPAPVAARESMFDESAEGPDSVFELSDTGAFAEEPLGPEAGATQLDMPGSEDIAPQVPRERAPAATPPPDMTAEELAARQIVAEAITPPIVDLANEIRRSVDFYRRQHRNEEVDRLFLSGGSAPIVGLDHFLAAETGIATSPADPFAYLTVHEDIAPREYLRDIGPTMVVAVGLALRDMVE